MKRRAVFSEIVEGFNALAAERQCTLTLRRVEMESKPEPLSEPLGVLAGRGGKEMGGAGSFQPEYAIVLHM